MELPTKIGQGLEQKKTHRIELPNGVYFDLREKSRGVYEITDLGKDGRSFLAMMLTAKLKKRDFQDLENPEHKLWSWAAGDTDHFKYKDVEFNFGVVGGGEIRAKSLKAIQEAITKLDIYLVDPADRDY